MKIMLPLTEHKKKYLRIATSQNFYLQNLVSLKDLNELQWLDGSTYNISYIQKTKWITS